MRVPIMNLNQVGIVTDVNPHDLPVNAWSNGRNVRFSDGRAEKAKGYDHLLTPTIPPYFLLPVDSPLGYFWLYAGAAKIYAAKEQIHTDITRLSGDYSSGVGNKWTGGLLNGLPILNTFSDAPQVWTTQSALTKLVDLPAWPAGWRCKSLRPFKNYLVALGVETPEGYNPHRVVWSHLADPGTVPSSWNIADATKDAGDVVLADTDGALVDQCDLGDYNILYKNDSAYIMRHVGGLDIMAFKRIKRLDGIIAPNAVCEIEQGGRKHVVFGANDVYVHDGNQGETLLRGQVRNWLFRNLDSANYKNSFVAHNVDTKEVYICFPEAGKIYPSLAIVWDYRNNTTTFKELPQVNCAGIGRAIPDFRAAGPDSWSNSTGTWAEDNSPWGASEFAPISNRLIMGSAQNTKIYLQDTGTTYAGDAVHSMLERVGLNILGQDASGKPIFDTDSVKIVTEVWPRIKAPKGVKVNIYLGSQNTQDAPIKWKGPYVYEVGKNSKVNTYVQGKILSVKFEVLTKEDWSFSGYDLEIAPGGKY